MKSSTNFILTAIATGLLVNLASAYLGTQVPIINSYAAILILTIIVGWVVFLIMKLVSSYFIEGRYAVEILFINSKNELLFINHPFHKCLVPPSARLKLWQIPHKTIAETLFRETGITNHEYELHPKFHTKEEMISEKVEDVPRPYAVQTEHRRQRGFVRFHHTFLYVCRFKNGDLSLKNVRDYQPRWVSLEEMRKMKKDLRPFEDLFWRYEKLLKELDDDLPLIVKR